MITHPVANTLRDLVADIRRRPVPLSDLIPAILQAADHLDDMTTRLAAKEQSGEHTVPQHS